MLTEMVAQKIRISDKRYDIILAITNGGIIPAQLVARELEINIIKLIPIRNKELIKKEMPLMSEDKKYLIIDDIYDSGDTFFKVCRATGMFNCDFAFLMSRRKYTGKPSAFIGKILNHNKWIVFPWEMKGNRTQ